MLDNRQSPIANLLRAYKGLLRAALGLALAYRAQALFWLVSAVFPLVMMTVWLAVVAEAGPVSGWNSADFISYYVAAVLVQRLTTNWAVWVWDEDIRTGGLSVKLLKPVDPVHSLVAEQLIWFVFDLVVLVPIIVLAALLLPTISYPIGPLLWLAVAASIAGGFLLNMLIGCTFGMVAFWTTQSSNLYSLFWGVGQFLAGFIAPIALFPAWFRNIATLLPFRSTVGFPVEIMLGRLTWAEIGVGFAVTWAWIAVFFVIYRALWRRGLRQYEAVGA